MTNFSGQVENELLAAVYDGPFEQPLWSSFLDRLRARMRASYAGIMFRPVEGTSKSLIELYSGQSAAPELQKLYYEELYKLDPVPYLQLREGRVYALTEMIDLNNPAHCAYLTNLLKPAGMNHMRMVRITEPSGVSAWLTIAHDKQDFSAADGALLSALAPHLRRALRNYLSVESERFRASVTTDVMKRLNFGWMSLDAVGRVVEISPHADRLLQHNGQIRLGKHGRLSATRPSIDRRLTDAIRACVDSPLARPHAINVSNDPWMEMLIVPIKERIQQATEQPIAIVYLQGDNNSSAGRQEQIAELFGLLPSEARLTLALSRGLNIKEAAIELGITIETARNYSKKIYSKVGARGQTDLVRIVLSSVLALA